MAIIFNKQGLMASLGEHGMPTNWQWTGTKVFKDDVSGEESVPQVGTVTATPEEISAIFGDAVVQVQAQVVQMAADLGVANQALVDKQAELDAYKLQVHYELQTSANTIAGFQALVDKVRTAVQQLGLNLNPQQAQSAKAEAAAVSVDAEAL